MLKIVILCIKVLIISFLTSVPYLTYAGEITQKHKKTIPFVYDEYIPVQEGAAVNRINYQGAIIKTNTAHVSTDEVKELIKEVKDSVCSTIGDADVRVWLSFDASGKVLGIGTSTQAGMEVSFHCKDAQQEAMPTKE